MQEILQEISNTPRCDVRIDRDEGVLYGVKIIGCKSRNRREYPNGTLREAIPLYENSKVNLDHPEGDPRKPRSYQDRFGVIRNIVLRENDGLFADFRFNPKHAVAEQLLWDAQNAPENVGFSHNVEAIVRKEDGHVIVEKILAVRSVDLVADPATTAGLFETVDSMEKEKHEQVNRESDAGPNPLIPLCKALLKEFREQVPGIERLVDDSFLETLSEERNDDLRKRLIDDRLRLVTQLRSETIIEAKPVAREQFIPEKMVDTKTFIKLIKR